MIKFDTQVKQYDFLFDILGFVFTTISDYRGN